MSYSGWIHVFPKRGLGAATFTAGVTAPPAPTFYPYQCRQNFEVPKAGENPRPSSFLSPPPPPTPLPASAAFSTAQEQGSSRASQAEWGLDSIGKVTAATGKLESSPPYPS